MDYSGAIGQYVIEAGLRSGPLRKGRTPGVLVERIMPILESGQTVELRILSGSMLPVLPLDALVTIAPIDGRKLRRGDIIVYVRDDVFVAHRLLLAPPPGGRGPCFEKGDNNPSGRWIRSGRIVGRVTAVVHGDGSRVDLESPDSRRLAAGAAGRSLRKDIRARILFIPGRIRHWLRRK